jgi:hypothetical protein
MRYPRFIETKGAACPMTLVVPGVMTSSSKPSPIPATSATGDFNPHTVDVDWLAEDVAALTAALGWTPIEHLTRSLAAFKLC